MTDIEASENKNIERSPEEVQKHLKAAFSMVGGETGQESITAYVLKRAISCGSPDYECYVEENGLDVGRFTPLTVVIRDPDLGGNYIGQAVVEEILAAGADPNLSARNNVPPLHMAATVHEDGGMLVETLLKSGADPNLQDDFGGDTPLHCAVGSAKADPRLVRILLEAGAEVNTAGYNGSTPLHLAVKAPTDIKIVEDLLIGGADVNVKDRYGRTPLHETVDADVAKRLLEQAADYMVRDDKGFKADELHRQAGREHIANIIVNFAKRMSLHRVKAALKRQA